MSIAAAMLTVLAVRLRWPDGRTWVGARLDGAPVAIHRGWLVPAGVGAVAIALPLAPRLSGPRIVLAATCGALGWFAVVQVRRSRSRALMARRRGEVVELVGLMAAELRAGVLPHRMVDGLSTDFAFLAPVARAADLGGDVAEALREVSSRPGREVLRDVAGAWQVSDRSGAPLASVIDRVEQSARVEREIAREIESGVAPARATARLMAGLPVVGLLLGSGMGGDPVEVLTGTWIGVGCLAVGGALACSGVAWIEHIAAAAGHER